MKKNARFFAKIFQRKNFNKHNIGPTSAQLLNECIFLGEQKTCYQSLTYSKDRKDF
jgi:hypothetical protein